MSEFEQIPFGAQRVRDIPSRGARACCCSITSESMEWTPDQQLNRGLADLSARNSPPIRWP